MSAWLPASLPPATQRRGSGMREALVAVLPPWRRHPLASILLRVAPNSRPETGIAAQARWRLPASDHQDAMARTKRLQGGAWLETVYELVAGLGASGHTCRVGHDGG